jgi:hypothetical protein
MLTAHWATASTFVNVSASGHIHGGVCVAFVAETLQRSKWIVLHSLAACDKKKEEATLIFLHLYKVLSKPIGFQYNCAKIPV